MPVLIGALILTGVTATDLKADLVERLDRLNQAVLYKFAGLSEYDVRRPMTSTATNLLGVAFHLASLNAEYFGETFGRPFPREHEVDYRTDNDADPMDDMWVRAESTSAWVVEMYRAAWEHAQETIARLDLDLVLRSRRGRMPRPRWWRCWCTWSTRPLAMQGTWTSCASSSTARSARFRATGTSSRATTGRPTANEWRPEPQAGPQARGVLTLRVRARGRSDLGR